MGKTIAQLTPRVNAELTDLFEVDDGAGGSWSETLQQIAALILVSGGIEIGSNVALGDTADSEIILPGDGNLYVQNSLECELILNADGTVQLFDQSGSGLRLDGSGNVSSDGGLSCNNDLNVGGNGIFSDGISSTLNSSANITWPASGTAYTNTRSYSIVLYLQNSAAVMTVVKNSTTLFSSVPIGAPVTVILSPSQTLTLTYLTGTITAHLNSL